LSGLEEVNLPKRHGFDDEDVPDHFGTYFKPEDYVSRRTVGSGMPFAK
jgi:hypothetical protein